MLSTDIRYNEMQADLSTIPSREDALNKHARSRRNPKEQD